MATISCRLNFFLCLLIALLAFNNFYAASESSGGLPTIVIDAGHGVMIVGEFPASGSQKKT